MRTLDERNADLTAIWSALAPSGTPEECLAAILAHKVAGAFVDVPVSAVAGYLGLRGVLTQIEIWLAGQTDVTPARIAASELLRAINNPHIAAFNTANAENRAALFGSLDVLVAASLLAADHCAALKAMATTSVPWWKASAFESDPGLGDLVAARLVPKPAAPPQDENEVRE